MKKKIYMLFCYLCQKNFALKLDERWTKEEERWQKKEFNKKFDNHEHILEIEVN